MPRADLQLQPQPPPAPPSPPIAASRTGRTWFWKVSPMRGSIRIAAWLKRPRSHGWTVAQLIAPNSKKLRISSEIVLGRMLASPGNRPLAAIVAPRRWWLQSLLGVACAGCVGTGEGVPAPPEGGAVPTTWPQIQAQILGPMCAQPCHHGGAAPKGLSLDDAGALQSLVGVASSEVPTMQRVAVGQPDQSYLIVKVAGTDARRVGARMPRLGPPFLTNGQIAALRKWISAGARADWDGNAADAGSTLMPGSDAFVSHDTQEEP